MKCSEKTVFTYFNDKKTKRNIPYSVAVVIYFVLMHNKEFTNAEERENLENEINRSFYSAFRKAFDLAGANYLKIEAEYGISHSTSYCYYTKKKHLYFLRHTKYRNYSILNCRISQT